MGSLVLSQVNDFLKGLISRSLGRYEQPQSEEDLRATFASRYHSFKLLITANSKAHEIRTEKVSTRSSALGADSEGRSFAGQFRSRLNLSCDSLLDGYREVVVGKYSLPAITYRLNMGIPDEEVIMCVGCVAMVDAICGGVMYSSDPYRL